MITLKRITYTLAAGLLALGVNAGAQAGTISSCAAELPDVTNNVTPNIGCAVLKGEANNNNSNVDGMFGVADWTAIAKVDPLPGTDGALKIVGDKLSGTWSVLQDVFYTYESVMLVFKDGSNAQPSNIVGYLIDVTSGNYDSPHFDWMPPKNGKPGYWKAKDISHVSLYVGNKKDCDIIVEFCGPPGVDPIPVPAGLPLLLTALASVGIISRKARKKA